jgi:hypothetical protein
MWLLKCVGGIELTEAELGCWDNVSPYVEIKSAAMVIQRQGAAPYVIEYSGYEEYCIARLANSAQGMPGNVVGYCITLCQQDAVLEHEIRPDGMRVILKPRNECDVPDRCFRRGLTRKE